MYCPNCGEKIKANAAYCEHCGAKLKDTETKPTIPKKGKGIASMVLGIIAAFYCLCAFGGMGEFDYTLPYYTGAGRIGFAIGFILIQSILAIIALCLSLAERSQNKNGFNTSGFWLAIATFIGVAIQFLVVLFY